MASLAPYSITLGATDYPVKYAGLLAYIEPYLTNLETFSFSGGNVGLGVTPGYAYAGWRLLQCSRDVTFGGVAGGPVYGFMAVNAYPDITTDPTTATWGYRLTGSLASRYEQIAGTHRWYTAPSGTAGNAITFTQAMTITSGGDLLVGTATIAGVGGVSFQSLSGGFAVINNNNAAATGYVFQSFRRSSTEIGSITQNGTTGVLYNTSSDRRLKENISPAPSAGEIIDAIEIVSHDWKSAPDEHVTFGVIAQDLALVAPQAVMQGDDGDEIEKTWGVDYSKLVPMLIKEIQQLRARVAALEQA